MRFLYLILHLAANDVSGAPGHTPSLVIAFPASIHKVDIGPGPKVIKLCSCSTQLSTKFILLIDVKMPTIVGILTFISRIIVATKS